MNGPERDERGAALGVLFVDISDSTSLYRRLGDEHARAVVLACLERLSQIVARLGGRVVDAIGDELMCTFDSPRGTIAAAVALQQAAAGWSRRAEGGEGISVRIGLEVGPVVRDGARVFGKTVYTAKRLATLAKARQVVTTANTTAQLGNSDAFPLRVVDWVVLKGDRSATEVLEVLWDPNSATEQRLDPGARATQAGVWLLYDGRELVVDQNRPEISIGRAESCDLVVVSPDVSLLHARIECRKGRPWLTDVSTNGTYVHADGAATSTLVHRDAVALAGGGHLGLGRSPVPGDETTIEFICRVMPEGPSDLQH